MDYFKVSKAFYYIDVGSFEAYLAISRCRKDIKQLRDCFRHDLMPITDTLLPPLHLQRETLVKGPKISLHSLLAIELNSAY